MAKAEAKAIIAQLKKGGKVVAEALGGRRLKSDETDPKVRILQNVVSEMAIAAGVLGGSLLEVGKAFPWVRAAIGHAPVARAG